MKRPASICMLLFACILAGCGGGLVADMPTGGYDGLIDQGWLKYNQASYDESYRLFDLAIKTDPARAEAYIGSGWSLLRRQHPDSATVVFRIGFSSITANADSVDALCGLAGSYLASGNNNKAATILKDYPVKDAEKAFPLKKHDFLIEYGHLEIVQAMAFYRLGLYSSTESADPDNALYHFNIVLAKPYTYVNPQELMTKMVEYLDRTEGGNFP